MFQNCFKFLRGLWSCVFCMKATNNEASFSSHPNLLSSYTRHLTTSNEYHDYWHSISFHCYYLPPTENSLLSLPASDTSISISPFVSIIKFIKYQLLSLRVSQTFSQYERVFMTVDHLYTSENFTLLYTCAA